MHVLVNNLLPAPRSLLPACLGLSGSITLHISLFDRGMDVGTNIAAHALSHYVSVASVASMDDAGENLPCPCEVDLLMAH